MDPLSEAIRERIDHLRYELEHDHRDHAVRGERIVLGDTVARYYESQQFRPQWRDPARLSQLVDSLIELANDGLDPNDYHFEALDGYRAELRAAKRLPDGEQAALEVLATDAMMLGLYHLYLGKVDPEKLSSQWNFESRPVSVERGFEALTQALASGKIRETFERARPQHVWYQRGRERLKEYRGLAAVGGWPDDPGRADDQAGDERSARAGAAGAAAVHPGPAGEAAAAAPCRLGCESAGRPRRIRSRP